MINRDAILAELLEIESLLQDDRLNDQDRYALHGAQRALRKIFEPDILAPGLAGVLPHRQPAKRGRFPASSLESKRNHDAIDLSPMPRNRRTQNRRSHGQPQVWQRT
jgi:hypothetical protein